MVSRILVHRALRFERLLRSQPLSFQSRLTRITSKPIPSLALALAMGAALPAEAETLLVEGGTAQINPDGRCSLAEAIENANADARVHADCLAGRGADVIDLDGRSVMVDRPFDGASAQGLPSISGPLVIEGRGATLLVPNVPVDTVIDVAPTGALELRDTVISGEDGSGSVPNAPRIRNAGSLYLSAVTVLLNYPAAAGITNHGRLEGERVTIDHAGDPGDLGDQAEGLGGNGLRNEGEAELRQLRISNLWSYGTGDEYSTLVNDGDLRLEDARIADGRTSYGVGVPGILNRGRLTGTAVHVVGNVLRYASQASVVNEAGAVLRLYDGEIAGNRLSGRRPGGAGGLDNEGEAVLERVDVVRNIGHGVRNVGDMRIVDSSISQNSGFYSGGSLVNSGTLELDGVTIGRNDATYGAAGLRNRGEATVLNSTIARNHGYDAAGVFNSGRMHVVASTIAGNSRSQYRLEGDGGAMVYNEDGGELSLVQTLVAAPLLVGFESATVGRLITNAGIIETRHNVFGDSGQSTADAIAGFVPDASDRLATADGDAPAPLDALVDVVFSSVPDRLLPNLTDNGGRTLTVALVPNSPAVDAVPPGACPPVDQRDVPRPQGGACDVGAFELRPEVAASTHFLRCPGDVDGNGVADLVVIDGNGAVTIATVNGTRRSGFTMDGIGQLLDAAVLPDTSTNGSPELAALGSDGTVQVFDALTGALLTTARPDTASEPTDLAALPDIGGDGAADLATLVDGQVLIHDGVHGALLESVTFSRYIDPVQLVTPGEHPPAGSALGVLGENRKAAGADKLEFRDPLHGGVTRSIWLGKRWKVHRAEPLDDLNGNGAVEWAVLRSENRLVSVQLRDGQSQAQLGTVPFRSWIVPLHLTTIPDINGNGSAELVVIGRYPRSGAQPLEVKDAATGELLQQAWFGRSFTVQDATRCPDVNGNGVPEIGLVGQHPTERRVEVILVDPLTGQRLRRLRF